MPFFIKKLFLALRAEVRAPAKEFGFLDFVAALSAFLFVPAVDFQAQLILPSSALRIAVIADGRAAVFDCASKNFFNSQKYLPFMSVQFHPEGRPGPEDTNWVFDEFIKTIDQKSK